MTETRLTYGGLILLVFTFIAGFLVRGCLP